MGSLHRHALRIRVAMTTPARSSQRPGLSRHPLSCPLISWRAVFTAETIESRSPAWEQVGLCRGGEWFRMISADAAGTAHFLRRMGPVLDGSNAGDVRFDFFKPARPGSTSRCRGLAAACPIVCAPGLFLVHSGRNRGRRRRRCPAGGLSCGGRRDRRLPPRSTGRHVSRLAPRHYPKQGSRLSAASCWRTGCRRRLSASKPLERSAPHRRVAEGRLASISKRRAAPGARSHSPRIRRTHVAGLLEDGRRRSTHGGCRGGPGNDFDGGSQSPFARFPALASSSRRSAGGDVVSICCHTFAFGDRSGRTRPY